MIDQNELKKKVGIKAAALVENGMLVGLGTGSTAKFFIEELAKRVKEEDLKIECISTSKASEELARSLNLRMLEQLPQQKIDLTVDGADEIDPQLNLIKGLGGALLMEKIVALHSKTQVIIADQSKIVSRLGEKTPLPVEVVPFGHEISAGYLRDLGLKTVLRQKDNQPYLTDQGNFIYDCEIPAEKDVFDLAEEVKSITGVVEHGFFLETASVAIVGNGTEIQIISSKQFS